MDLILIDYNHQAHGRYWVLFWPLFSSYWKEVNGKDLEKLCNAIPRKGEDHGPLIVSTELEQKILAVLDNGRRIKVVFDGYYSPPKPIAFVQYEIMEQEIIFIDSLYVDSDKRYYGITRFIMNSFPMVKKYFFEVHKGKRPEVLLNGMLSARKVADSERKDNDLEIWEADYIPQSQGSNDNVKDIKSKMRG